ncbi:MAG TPA: hypothetical protein VMW48_06480 [Vicinamibacterales bacterium]|nr:hypothetical protein [Vicinamibacterales bacterium]
MRFGEESHDGPLCQCQDCLRAGLEMEEAVAAARRVDWPGLDALVGRGDSTGVMSHASQARRLRVLKARLDRLDAVLNPKEVRT